jgi:transcription elongation factor Elf1
MTCRRTTEKPTSDEEPLGYIYTHFDCPECNEVCEVEGDAAGDTVTCDACGAHIKIRMVM